jgi:hypothetical protein
MALHGLEELRVFAMKSGPIDFVAGPTIEMNGKHDEMKSEMGVEDILDFSEIESVI